MAAEVDLQTRRVLVASTEEGGRREKELVAGRKQDMELYLLVAQTWRQAYKASPLG